MTCMIDVCRLYGCVFDYFRIASLILVTLPPPIIDFSGMPQHYLS